MILFVQRLKTGSTEIGLRSFRLTELYIINKGEKTRWSCPGQSVQLVWSSFYNTPLFLMFFVCLSIYIARKLHPCTSFLYIKLFSHNFRLGYERSLGITHNVHPIELCHHFMFVCVYVPMIIFYFLELRLFEFYVFFHSMRACSCFGQLFFSSSF